MGNPSSEVLSPGALLRRVCTVGLFGGLVIGACAGTDQNVERQRLLDEVNAAGNNKPAQCRPGIVEACYNGAPGTSGRGVCKGGNRTCSADAIWGSCTGEVQPRKETCNKTDDDCDGIVDNNFERDGASCLGQSQPLGYGIDGNDALGSEEKGTPDGELPDGAAAPYRHRLAALEVAEIRRHVAGRKDVGQKQDLLVAESVRNLDGPDVRIGHAEIFGLSARKAPEQMRVAEQSRRRMSPQLFGFFRVGIGALAS